MQATATTSKGGRRLRILFLVRPGTLLRFAVVVPDLAERGHQVEIAFTEEPTPRALRLARDLAGRFSNVTYGVAAGRGALDGWRQVAWTVRGLADLARYGHPRYSDAPGLRRRMEKTIVGNLRKSRDVEPIARALAVRMARRIGSWTDAELSQRVIRAAARMEDAIPASRRVTRYIAGRAPDVVLATGTFRHASEEVEYVKSARRLGIPTGVCVASWDNLTNKGLLKILPERVFVWNELQVREAAELHGVPAERVRATGAHVFDPWFERRPASTSQEFARRVGLDPARAFVVYLCSSPAIAHRREVAFVARWIEALRSSGDERVRRLGVVVRPHPKAAAQWRDVELGIENVVVWPAGGAFPVGDEARADFFDTLVHSAAAVGVNTTAMIEAAVVGKSVLTVLVPEYAQEDTLHFRYLLDENGGFLHVAASLDEHVEQLRGVLDRDAADAARAHSFMGSFVRPGGVERPAAPILSGAIEELAAAPVDPPPRLGSPLLRSALVLEAAVQSIYNLARLAPGALRRPAGPSTRDSRGLAHAPSR